MTELVVEKDMVASVHYTGTFPEDGEEFDNPLGKFEDQVKSFEGVTEIETLEMGRL